MVAVNTQPMVCNCNEYWISFIFCFPAFIGFTDNTTCDFGSSSTCQWQLQQANLTSADNAPSPLPSTDAVGSTPAYYISGQPLATTVSSIQLIRYPSLSYVCGYSFYYQTQSGVRLVLKATNGIVWWESGVTGTSSWERVNVTVGELSPEVDWECGGGVCDGQGGFLDCAVLCRHWRYHTPLLSHHAIFHQCS